MWDEGFEGLAILNSRFTDKTQNESSYDWFLEIASEISSTTKYYLTLSPDKIACQDTQHPYR
jgi:hypothetical protein